MCMYTLHCIMLGHRRSGSHGTPYRFSPGGNSFQNKPIAGEIALSVEFHWSFLSHLHGLGRNLLHSVRLSELFAEDNILTQKNVNPIQIFTNKPHLL